MTDNRCTEIADAIKLGVQRILAHSYNAASLCEVGLPNNRRADVMAIGPKGEIHIVEVKSSIQDFRSDSKWPEYADYCDYFYFAVAPDFPIEILPPEKGLILADAYGGEVIRSAEERKISAARRKIVLIRQARLASWRLNGQEVGL